MLINYSGQYGDVPYKAVLDVSTSIQAIGYYPFHGWAFRVGGKMYPTLMPIRMAVPFR